MKSILFLVAVVVCWSPNAALAGRGPHGRGHDDRRYQDRLYDRDGRHVFYRDKGGQHCDRLYDRHGRHIYYQDKGGPRYDRRDGINVDVRIEGRRTGHYHEVGGEELVYEAVPTHVVQAPPVYIKQPVVVQQPVVIIERQPPPVVVQRFVVVERRPAVLQTIVNFQFQEDGFEEPEWTAEERAAIEAEAPVEKPPTTVVVPTPTVPVPPPATTTPPAIKPSAQPTTPKQRVRTVTLERYSAGSISVLYRRTGEKTMEDGKMEIYGLTSRNEKVEIKIKVGGTCDSIRVGGHKIYDDNP